MSTRSPPQITSFCFLIFVIPTFPPDPSLFFFPTFQARKVVHKKLRFFFPSFCCFFSFLLFFLFPPTWGCDFFSSFFPIQHFKFPISPLHCLAFSPSFFELLVFPKTPQCFFGPMSFLSFFFFYRRGNFSLELFNPFPLVLFPTFLFSTLLSLGFSPHLFLPVFIPCSLFGGHSCFPPQSFSSP